MGDAWNFCCLFSSNTASGPSSINFKKQLMTSKGSPKPRDIEAGACMVFRRKQDEQWLLQTCDYHVLSLPPSSACKSVAVYTLNYNL